MNIDLLKKNPYLWDLYICNELTSDLHQNESDRKKNGFIPNRSPSISEFLSDNNPIQYYPDDKQFSICLTHDIDEIYQPRSHQVLSCLNSLIKKKNLSSFGVHFSSHRTKENSPYWNFKEIMELENEYGATSSFYFMATEMDPHRFRYNIEDLEGELGYIADNGFEVGLHGGYYAYNNFDAISSEKKRLEKVLGKNVMGYRNHYLRFEYPLTLEYLDKAGFSYDTTLGYNFSVGFRNGMCHPFHPYNSTVNSNMTIIEIPMAIMDGALFFVEPDFDKAWVLVQQMIDKVASLHGVLCLNWHNVNFSWSVNEKMKLMYEKILQYGYEKEAWMTNGNNIANYVKSVSI